MVFQTGNTDGRQRHTTRSKIVQELVDLFGENLALIKQDMADKIKDNPLQAYQKYLFPLLPKNIELSNDSTEQFNLVINKTYVKEGERVDVD